MFSRTLKRLVAKTGIIILLLTQLAVAAYACPTMATPGEMTPAAMADDTPTMPGCEGLDASNPSMCLQHCQAGSQSVQTTPEIPVPPVLMMPLAFLEPVQMVSGVGITEFSVFLEREASPPPLVRFRVLRI